MSGEKASWNGAGVVQNLETEMESYSNTSETENNGTTTTDTRALLPNSHPIRSVTSTSPVTSSTVQTCSNGRGVALLNDTSKVNMIKGVLVSTE